MGTNEKKIEILLGERELASLLRHMAAVFRNASLPDALKGFAADVECASRLGLSLKLEDGLAELKLKVKAEGALAAPRIADPAGLSFRELKKHLKAAFKHVEYFLDTSSPPAEAVDTFLRYSEAMCAHPDRGDQDYGPHAALCAELKAASERKDTCAMRALMRQLKAVRKSCHARAK